jgi:hypothetical protein
MSAVADLPHTVGLIDDESDLRSALARRLTKVGFEVRLVVPSSPSLAETVIEVMGSAEAAFCDHYLSAGLKVEFSGAELVASLTAEGFPSVLFTGVLPAEQYAIRKNMASIPALLTRDSAEGLSGEPLVTALTESVSEVRDGNPPSRRRGRRTPVTILDWRTSGTQRLVEGLVAGWGGTESIDIPAELLARPWCEDPAFAVGHTFFASINISEIDPSKLFFDSFEEEPATVDELLGNPAD